MANRAVIFTTGKTHQIYINLSDEEADRRFQIVRDDMNELELELERKNGISPKRDVVEFEDEILIWGGIGDDINDMVQMLFKKMSDA